MDRQTYIGNRAVRAWPTTELASQARAAPLACCTAAEQKLCVSLKKAEEADRSAKDRRKAATCTGFIQAYVVRGASAKRLRKLSATAAEVPLHSHCVLRRP
eukprot:scaffold952_cov249-Pinguiococcus_pyrenoidosus.AAC.6